jgi:hypothetical protein
MIKGSLLFALVVFERDLEPCAHDSEHVKCKDSHT